MKSTRLIGFVFVGGSGERTDASYFHNSDYVTTTTTSLILVRRGGRARTTDFLLLRARAVCLSISGRFANIFYDMVLENVRHPSAEYHPYVYASTHAENGAFQYV